jgi:putative transcriptional regulator
MQEVNKIKGYRVMVGLTQTEIAKKLNMSERTYATKEQNPNKFTINELNQLEVIFNESGLKISKADLI